MVETYKDFINKMARYKEWGSDYWVLIDGQKVPTGKLLLMEPNQGRIVDGVTIIGDELFNRSHADNININEFWETATDKFPLFSIAGAGDFTNIEEVNVATLGLAERLGALTSVRGAMSGSKVCDKKNFLEIGCGYGGFYNWFQDNYRHLGRYFGLDVVRLFECDTLAIGDGYTIPDTLPAKFDLIYSINVFQHLSTEQRQSYFKSIGKKLTDGGQFIFGLYAQDQYNMNTKHLWGSTTENGDRLAHFLGQFTIVPTVSEIYEELGNVGLAVAPIMTDKMTETQLSLSNYRVFIATRPQG